jgi:hypothetical protein
MTSPQPAPLLELTKEVATTAQALGRADLSNRLSAAAVRASRPATVVCVVGEFKQGKSSLINALMGEDLCPVDDDLATSVLTVLRYGRERTVVVRRRAGEDMSVEQIDSGQLADWVTERGNPGNEKNVDRVDLLVPHPLLANGLVIVDTPGMGGLGAGHAAATLAFLPFADGLILVSDVSAELSAPEMELLSKARELCPLVLLAQTKIDLYPEWRRIVQVNRDHLTAAGADIVSLPLSAVLWSAASARHDSSLAERSGYPALVGALHREVIEPAKQLAHDRARAEVGDALAQLEAPMQEELQILDDPRRGEEAVRRLEEAKAHLEHLKGPAARWSIHLGDATTDLAGDVNHHLRGSVREVQREMDESVELLKSPEDWDGLAARLQARTAEAIADAFGEIEEGGRRIQAELADLLAADSVDLTPIGSVGSGLDVAELWRGKGVGTGASKAGAALGTALTGLRGAQSGMIMLGMVGQFLPRGATLLLMSNPVTLGLGAAFAGMQLVDAHKRKIAARRQQARMQVRQFLDDVGFESGHRINESLRDLQRTLRDQFSEKIADLQRTYAEAAQQSQQAVQTSREEAAIRKAELTSRLSTLDALRSRLQDLP